MMSMHRLVFITIMLITAALSFSQPSEKLLQKAEKGNAKAQYEVAWKYSLYGDTIQAINWYKKAAEKGYIDACYELADIYDKKREYNEAVKWCKKCDIVTRDIVIPWRLLGDYYLDGKGVEKNFIEAVYWYEKYLQLCKPKKVNDLWGYMDQYTMVNLAACYDSLGNYTDALRWYSTAFTAKSVLQEEIAEYRAIEGIIRLYHLGLGVQKDQNRVNDLLRLYERYIGSYDIARHAIEIAIKKDDDMSLFWAELSAQKGSAIGKYWMGWIYEFGKYGVEKDEAKAFEWYQKAVDEKYIDAYFRLGLMYEKGRAIPKNYEHAYQLYKIVSDYCANIDNKSYLLQEAMGRLGVMYYYGHYVDMDQDKAFGFLLDGVYSFDDAEVMKTLSSCYRYGKGTTEDVEKAEYWLDMAEKYGDETAIWLRELERTRNEINANK